tara:strand:+ start:45 stop:485 length:441 start_codon:yes stop_codon:yes gene_type:complete
MTIKSFKGQLADEEQDKIILHTNDGSTGYRIKKFQVLGPDASETAEATIKIYKVEQTTITGDIDFSDNTLLAAAIYQQNATGQNYPIDAAVIFDNEIFNQDIYISQRGDAASAKINYYIELEQIKLDLSENTVATLKDIRNETLTV